MERRYFSQTHYLALVCDEGELRRRLLSRPDWRKSAQAGELPAQLDYNRWLKTAGPNQTPTLTLLDTTSTTVEDSAKAVKEWMNLVLSSATPGTD